MKTWIVNRTLEISQFITVEAETEKEAIELSYDLNKYNETDWQGDDIGEYAERWGDECTPP